MSINKKAFTLVELIVVIVILAILATIAFLSFSSQSASARDSTRLSDMSNIAKGLSVFNATAGSYPKPDNSISITASGVTIGQQGYAGSSVLNMIKISNGGKDPLDNSTYYTYSVNSNSSKFQILGFLEDGNSSALSYLPRLSGEGWGEGRVNADPSSYSGRYVMTKGDALGILLQSGSMVPAQVALANIDLIRTTSPYIAMISNKITISGTGSQLFSIIPVINNGLNFDYKCDAADISVGNQIWQACNIGSNKSGTGAENYGVYFQWGRNMPSIGQMITGPLSSEPNTYNLVSTTEDWLLVQNDDLWGGSGATYNSTKTYSSQNASQKSLMKGPCKDGYHIPTTYEWGIAYGTTTGTGIIEKLKLPFTGRRHRVSGGYIENETIGKYWSANPYNSGYPKLGVNFIFTNSTVTIANGENRGDAVTIRCVKN